MATKRSLQDEMLTASSSDEDPVGWRVAATEEAVGRTVGTWFRGQILDSGASDLDLCFAVLKPTGMTNMSTVVPLYALIWTDKYPSTPTRAFVVSFSIIKSLSFRRRHWPWHPQHQWQGEAPSEGPVITRILHRPLGISHFGLVHPRLWCRYEPVTILFDTRDILPWFWYGVATWSWPHSPCHLLC